MIRHITRHAVAVLAVVALAVVAPHPSAAQEASTAPAARHRWELHGSSGTLVPTGALADAVKRAPISTAQLSYLVRERLALTTTAGWARSRDLTSGGLPRVSIFTYDVGAEARTRQWGGSTSAALFIGTGVGGRSYDHRDRNVDATHGLAGYAAVGGDLGVRRLHLRLEARDYATRVRPLTGAGAARTRNDVVVLAGLRLARKPVKD